MPEAIERALAVLKHMQSLGGKLSDFCVTVTAEEGFDLIDWFRARATADNTDIAMLDADIEIAKASDDPWLVLQHYELFGLKIVKRLH